MTNVALMNYAYGVPVKLYATMIVFSAAVLLLYDARRLLAVLVRNQPAPAETSSPLFEGRIPPAARWSIKVTLLGSVVVSSVVAMKEGIGRRATPFALDGRWIVSSFTVNGQPLDSTGNPARWRRVVFDGARVMIRLESDAAISCERKPSSTDSTMELACAKDRRADLRWTLTGDTLVVSAATEPVPLDL
jgi:hypothetical protein